MAKIVEKWRDSAVFEWLRGWIQDTWDQKITWHRTVGGRWWIRRHYVAPSVRVYIDRNRLIWTVAPERRYISRPLTGQELGPLLEAIVFSRETQDE